MPNRDASYIGDPAGHKKSLPIVGGERCNQNESSYTSTRVRLALTVPVGLAAPNILTGVCWERYEAEYLGIESERFKAPLDVTRTLSSIRIPIPLK